jgi:hypothetical protein
MTTYQVLTFDMGHINAIELVEADDDAAAIERAKSLFVECEREVWQESRFISRLAPRNGERAAPDSRA